MARTENKQRIDSSTYHYKLKKSRIELQTMKKHQLNNKKKTTEMMHRPNVYICAFDFHLIKMKYGQCSHDVENVILFSCDAS